MNTITNTRSYSYSLLDKKALLAPIQDDSGVGIYLRYENVYDDISAEIRINKLFLPRDLQDEQTADTNWEKVGELCRVALEVQSKDIQLAAWLMLSLLHTNGLQGLQEGLQLLDELCARYWDGIHPVLAADLDIRLAPFIWIDRKIESHLQLTDLTAYARPPTTSTQSSGQSHNLAGINHDGQLESFFETIQNAPPEFLQDATLSTTICIEIIDTVKRCLQQEFGSDAPTFTTIRVLLEQILLLDTQAAEKQRGTITASKPDTETALAVAFSFETEQIFMQLESFSTQLIQSDPKCPTGYLLQLAMDSRTHNLRDAVNLLSPETSLWEQVNAEINNTS